MKYALFLTKECKVKKMGLDFVSMIGVIGGSGFYQLGDNPKTESLETPFGRVAYQTSSVDGTEVVFIPRHGKNHSFPPHKINYRANVWAIHDLEVEYAVATNALGLLHQQHTIGDLCVPDQILDMTHDRPATFFDDPQFSITNNSDRDKSGVVHTDVTHPFNQIIRKRLLDSGEELNEPLVNGGTVVVTQGPKFETPAEISAYRLLGADYVGMTSAPEAFLAREIEIPYASLGIITNYAAGIQTFVSSDEVFGIFSRRIQAVKTLLKYLIAS